MAAFVKNRGICVSTGPNALPLGQNKIIVTRLFTSCMQHVTIGVSCMQQ